MPNTQVDIPMNIHLNMDLCIFTLEYAEHYELGANGFA